MTFGKSYHLDLENCPDYLLDSRVNIIEWLHELLLQIDMHIEKPEKASDPCFWIKKYGNEDHIKGFTLLVPITTSNITLHTVPETEKAHIDIFSCKEFDTEIVNKVCQKYFEGNIKNSKLLTRE